MMELEVFFYCLKNGYVLEFLWTLVSLLAIFE